MNAATIRPGGHLAPIAGSALLSADQRRDFEAFESGALAEQDFHHRQHVRMGWIYLRLFSPLQALERFCSALKRFARLKGKPGLYHETITWAYLFLINQRMHEKPGLNWPEFEARNPDLMQWKGGILEKLYDKERLFSELARQIFLLPDAGISRRGAKTQREAEEGRGALTG